MCSQVNKDYTPKAGYITDTFDLTGKIYMACTFNFVNGKTYINKFIPLKWKWYMGDVLKSQDSAKKTFTWAPAPMWFSIPPLALGIGKGHVELYEGDTLLVTKNFEIVEKLPDTTPAESASK
jgi:hypothetical protein